MVLPPILRRNRWTLAAFVASVMVAAMGVVVREGPAWQISRETRREFNAGRYSEAAASAGRWLGLRPGSAEAHFFHAKAAIALGRRRDFVESLLKARSLGYPEVQLEVLQALIDAQAGRFELARPVLIRAFNEATAPDLMVDEALARLLMELYDWPRAGAVLGRWGQDAPTDPRPPLWQAAVNRRRDSDPEEIIANFREALRRAPGLPEARLGLAEELVKAGKHRDASVEFQAYLAQVPDDPAAQLGAGRNALELGDLDVALRRFDLALTLDPDNAEAHIEKAKFSRLRGEEADALVHLDKAISLKPYDPAPRYNRRLALLRLGRADDARKEQEAIDLVKSDLDRMNGLRERLDRSPNDASLQCRLAFWMLTHGFDQEGLKWAAKILTDHPGHRETCQLLARYHEQKGHTELAAYYQSESSKSARH